MPGPTYYAILNVAPTSDEVVIRAAYKALMRKFHPDTNKSADATKRAAAINQAYAILSDPVKRSAYDNMLRLGGAGSGRPRQDAPSPPYRRPPGSSPRSFGKPGSQPPGRGPDDVFRSALLPILTFAAIGSMIVFGILAKPDAEIRSRDVTITTSAGDETIPDNMASIDVNASDFAQELALLANQSDDLDLLEDPTYRAPTPLSYDEIEEAASEFDRILRQSGMAGARAHSRKCHSAAQIAPSWLAADRCAAFDFAASYVDAESSAAAGASANGYFAFQNGNQADNYKILGAVPYTLTPRLQAIRRAVQPAVAEALRVRLAASSTQMGNQTMSGGKGPADDEAVGNIVEP